ncbi:MORN-repeat protein [Orpheovirus IHUMI-LCC2]|uniref:MORN-repeat protein n=1 Tax=Orpheovirus IHUMI-LCC2 TaxID=2023057 RepID=A0A2I2L5I4_9VIRU|nr:MORN-repeat protein [Orpheovirus IHUMI-LCC2]SNW62808.1 MORN-repeat protein [Orpheovirus IHUMI-LCC2]
MLQSLNSDVLYYMVRNDSVLFCALYAVSKYFNSICKQHKDWRKEFVDVKPTFALHEQIKLVIERHGLLLSTSKIQFDISYYPCGQIKRKSRLVEYDSVKSDGKELKYYRNGQLKSITNWKKGQRHGEHIEWSFGSKYKRFVLESGMYKDGKKIGVHKQFHENGEQMSMINYSDNGQLHGVSKEWDKDGRPLKEIHYENGRRIGLEKEWNYLHEEYTETVYDNGLIVGVKIWYMLKANEYKRTGVKVQRDYMKQKKYFKDGKICEDTQYDENGKEKRIIIYHPDGRVNQSTTFSTSHCGDRTVYKKYYRYNGDQPIVYKTEFIGPN